MVRREKTRAGLEESLVVWRRPGMVHRAARVDRFLGEGEAEAEAEAGDGAEAEAEVEAETVPSIPG